MHTGAADEATSVLLRATAQLPTNAHSARAHSLLAGLLAQAGEVEQARHHALTAGVLAGISSSPHLLHTPSSPSSAPSPMGVFAEVGDPLLEATPRLSPAQRAELAQALLRSQSSEPGTWQMAGGSASSTTQAQPHQLAAPSDSSAATPGEGTCQHSRQGSVSQGSMLQGSCVISPPAQDMPARLADGITPASSPPACSAAAAWQLSLFLALDDLAHGGLAGGCSMAQGGVEEVVRVWHKLHPDGGNMVREQHCNEGCTLVSL